MEGNSISLIKANKYFILLIINNKTTTTKSMPLKNNKKRKRSIADILEKEKYKRKNRNTKELYNMKDKLLNLPIVGTSNSPSNLRSKRKKSLEKINNKLSIKDPRSKRNSLSPRRIVSTSKLNRFNKKKKKEEAEEEEELAQKQQKEQKNKKKKKIKKKSSIYDDILNKKMNKALQEEKELNEYQAKELTQLTSKKLAQVFFKLDQTYQNVNYFEQQKKIKTNNNSSSSSSLNLSLGEEEAYLIKKKIQNC